MRTMSSLVHKLRSYGRVIRRARYDGVPDAVRLLIRRPAIMAGVGAYEAGLMASDAVDGRLKVLAQIKTGSLIGCPF